MRSQRTIHCNAARLGLRRYELEVDAFRRTVGGLVTERAQKDRVCLDAQLLQVALGDETATQRQAPGVFTGRVGAKLDAFCIGGLQAFGQAFQNAARFWRQLRRSGFEKDPPLKRRLRR